MVSRLCCCRPPRTCTCHHGRLCCKSHPPHALPCASQIRHHLQSFLAGGVAALSFGYYRVHQDVWEAAEAVDSRLDRLGRETVSSQAKLQARVVALEGEVSKLKGAIAASKE